MIMQMSSALSLHFLQMNRKLEMKSKGSLCHQIPLLFLCHTFGNDLFSLEVGSLPGFCIIRSSPRLLSHLFS